MPLDRVEACTPDAPKVNKSLIDLIQKNKKYDIEFEVHKKDGGDRLIIELKKIRQEIPVILCTGFSDNITHETISSIGIDRLLIKPIIREELASAVRGILDNHKKRIRIPSPNTTQQYC